jgi:hypothetical protein
MRSRHRDDADRVYRDRRYARLVAVSLTTRCAIIGDERGS